MHSRSHGLKVLIPLDCASSFSMEGGINIRKSEENRSSTLASMKFAVIITSIAIAASATARSLTVYNACPFTIW